MFNRGEGRGGGGGTTFGLSYREVQDSKGLGIASKTISFFLRCGEELARNRAT